MQWGDGMMGVGQSGRSLAAGSGPGERHEAFGGASAVLAGFSGPVLKTQATGPVTLAAALRAGGAVGSGLLDRVADALLGRIDDHLEWIRSETDIDEIVLVLDEPSLVALGVSGSEMPAAVAGVLGRVIASVNADVGVHCCGDTDWGTLAELGPDWLSWDLAELGMGFHAGVDRIAVALGRGTRVMWGIVPTSSVPLPDQNVIMGRYGTAVANLVVAGAPFESLRSEAWFTPACGLAGLSVGDAEAVATLLQEVVEEVDSGW